MIVGDFQRIFFVLRTRSLSLTVVDYSYQIGNEVLPWETRTAVKLMTSVEPGWLGGVVSFFEFIF